MSLVQRRVPGTTDAENDVALALAQTYLHSLGVTAWQDAILGAYAGNGDPASAYLRAVEAGTLTARVRGALWWERDRGLEQVEGLLERRATYTRGRLDAGSVKVMQDGVVENYTAAMSLPYRDGCGGHTHNSGLSFVDPAVLRAAVTRLDAEGFGVHVHAIGDRAVAETLDAFAAARAANGRTRGRHHVAHLQFVAPADRPRFAELDVTANIQALWAVNDEAMTEMTLPFVDESVAGWQYPFASLAAAGVRLAAGQRLAGEHARPAGRDPRRGEPGRGRVRRRAVPAPRGADPGAGLRRVHQRRGVREPPRRHRPARARAAGRPRGARPGPVRR